MVDKTKVERANHAFNRYRRYKSAIFAIMYGTTNHRLEYVIRHETLLRETYQIARDALNDEELKSHQAAILLNCWNSVSTICNCPVPIR